MVPRLVALFLLLSLLLPAAKKTSGSGRGENEDLILAVTLYCDPDDVKGLIGNNLDGHFIVAEVKVQPKYGKEIAIDRDDFVLRTDKDGEKSKPFAAGQIAGSTALIVSQDGAETKRSRGWTMGGPVMMGGGGNAGQDDKDKPKPVMKEGEQNNPLKKVLEEKILPEKKTEQPVAGLLYFPMEKQKLKDLELYYGGTENRITLRFK